MEGRGAWGLVSAAGWSKDLRVSRAVLLEAARLALGAWLVITIVFLAFQVWSLAPSASLIPRNPKDAPYIQQNIDTFALNTPVWNRYAVWFGDVFTGHLGTSYFYGKPVADVVLNVLPVTLELLLGTALWAAALGIVLGWAVAGRFRALGALVRGAGWVLYAIPVFWSLLLLWIGVLIVWGSSLFMPFGPGNGPPRVTGALVLDALLSGNLYDAWLAFWTTALLTLPAGAGLSLPVLLRVRSSLRRATRAPGARLSAALAAVLSSLGVLLPLLVSAVFVEEALSSRRGVAWVAIGGLDELDAPLFQGAVVVLGVLAVAAAAPFCLLGAALLRKEAVPQGPARAPDASGVRRWSRATFPRLGRRSSVALWIGLALVAVPLLLTAAASSLTPYNPLLPVTDTACSPGSPRSVFLQPPCPAHPLGTDRFGYDVWSRVLYGGNLMMGVTLTALGLGAGIALVVALLVAVLGRGADGAVRAGLGAVAAIPGLVLLFLFAVAGIGIWVVSVLLILFVPVLFRDARDRLAPSEPGLFASGSGALDRLAAATAVAPAFLATLPRRMAEMALLFETFTFFVGAPRGAEDWGAILRDGLISSAWLYGNYLWIVVPGVLLFLFSAGLFLLSDGLRSIVEPDEASVTPVPPAPVPPAAAAGNP